MSVSRRAHTALPAALLIAVTAILTGCSGTSDAADATGSSGARSSSGPAGETDADAVSKGAERSGTPQTVGCPDKATAVKLPAGFLAPLPEGTVVVAVEKRSGGRTVVTGVVPGAEHDVLKKMQTAYLAAGLTL